MTRPGPTRRVTTDTRAVSPAVGKTLEIGMGVLVIALLTSTLYGSVIPDYRANAGAELADAALARALSATEGVTPPPAASVSVTTHVNLPATIRGATYEITATGTRLELRHPHPRIGRSVPLSLPTRVVSISGTWRSTRPFVVTASGNRSAVTLQIGGST